MKITDVTYTPTYFDTYISQVADLHLSEALQQSLEVIDALDLDKLHAIGDQVYAPGKWTLRDLFQHVTDTERIFAYRALRFARNDKTELPGFDENLFAEYSGATRHSLTDILAELRCVRQSSILLFNSFDEAALLRTGIMVKKELPVLALGFTLVGHQNHHIRIMEERYFPMLQTV
jgi:hypothetical protein